MHYSYHNRIKQRIEAGELTGFEYVDEHNKIKPCLLLYFNTDPYLRPVRIHRFRDYEFITNNKELEILSWEQK